MLSRCLLFEVEKLEPCIVAGRAAMLEDIHRRWIDNIGADARQFFMCASICDPRFKDLDVFKVFPCERAWKNEATEVWIHTFDKDWSEPNLATSNSTGSHSSKQPATKTSGVTSGSLFSNWGTEQESETVDSELSCVQERNVTVYLAMPSIPRQGQ